MDNYRNDDCLALVCINMLHSSNGIAGLMTCEKQDELLMTTN